MATQRYFTKQVKYEPNVGTGSGIDLILRGNHMKEFMEGEVGLAGAAVARQHTDKPNEITAEPIQTVTRWAVNIINEASNAMAQEYGAGSAPLAPLGHVLNFFRQIDPNRRQQLINRLLGR